MFESKNAVSIFDLDESKTQYFKSLDSLIIAAYKYVQDNGGEVVEISLPKKLSLGLMSSDGHYFIASLVVIKRNSHELVDSIKNSQLTIVDYINLQLDSKLELLKFYA